MLVLLLSGLAGGALAQSSDIEFPTPVRTDEISGAISARDVGDPRLTRYFYSFTGTPGDLIITVESTNLNGDVDVFTAGSLRPLAKVSLYAGGAATSAAKTIYLKNRESLILRVEARTPNDNPGNFRIRFQGGFEPISGDVPALGGTGADAAPATATGPVQKGRRVTSTGARIEEPEVETQASASPAGPANTPPASGTTETPAPAAAPARRTTTPRRAPGGTTRNRPTRPARTPRPRPVTPPPTTPPAPAEEPASSTAAAATAATAAAAQPAAGPRLIIELRDGMRVERYMTTVRRVTVENGLLVVVTRDGKVSRQPMTNVLRMAIEP
ncbi:MAG TPA: hypothetical protein VF723_02395 [Pyrinomonadaceae bacterium]